METTPPPSLFLLDGMALIYRAHFAFMRAPITTSAGINTSALYGFTATLIDLLKKEQPTHLAIAMDTPEPTQRHRIYPPYKAQRDEIPEDIVAAIPQIKRLAEAFRIPLLAYPGWEADDVIGTIARLAEPQGLLTYMVTPDKDFAQLVTDRTLIYKPGRAGNDTERIDPHAVREKWLVAHPPQVADVLGLWGDASDNIPGIPGFGEKTAKALIQQYGTIENLIAHAGDLKGKQKERVEQFAEQALLSKRLATICTEVPVKESIHDLALRAPDEAALRSLFTEFEFNTLGRRLFGETFKAGHGGALTTEPPPPHAPPEQGELFAPSLKSLKDVPHDYQLVDSVDAIHALVADLLNQTEICIDLETDRLDVSQARIAGVALAARPGQGWYVRLPEQPDEARRRLHALQPLLASPTPRKIGHNLKFDLSVLAWHDLPVNGDLFDTMIAHVLIEPDRRHGLDALAEQYLNYTPIPIRNLIGEGKDGQRTMFEAPVEDVVDYAVEDADVALQLKHTLEPQLNQSGQHNIFYNVEMPLLRVLIAMEREGIRLDAHALSELSDTLQSEIIDLDARIQDAAGTRFNVNSPKQLGEILFDILKLAEKPKRTKTGQYATGEDILETLARDHPIARLILDYREAAKLKSTYVDTLPQSINPRTGRIHTSFSQTGAATGRLASANPNLQNIPIRTPAGRLIRKAFVPRDPHHRLLAADYSQIELRVMADMSRDPGLCEAFERGEDIHQATASRVFGVPLHHVTDAQRRTAKMVNFGIMYGISAFGLSQRIEHLSRTDAADIIKTYFATFPRVKAYMDHTIAFCREHGYVETKSGRRRFIRDISSQNATLRAAAERTAINSPIQGTAADMIKLAMTRIARELDHHNLRTRMLLQVHDELVFDMPLDEEDAARQLIRNAMINALPLAVPIVVDIGIGANWLEAH
ncbi:MAG TPA: DNA polymerase I [Kiritimatiellia bacterium]|nr:DNA polymerase I [Kiritimatiellia bacterium]